MIQPIKDYNDEFTENLKLRYFVASKSVNNEQDSQEFTSAQAALNESNTRLADLEAQVKAGAKAIGAQDVDANFDVIKASVEAVINDEISVKEEPHCLILITGLPFTLILRYPASASPSYY